VADDPLVENAADEEQVKRGADTERARLKRERHELRMVLKTDIGRRVLFRFLRHCGVFNTVLGPDAQITAFNAGRQDVGHWLMAVIEKADDAALYTMMSEHRAQEKADAEANAASRIKSVSS
jgi:hypothetical protein